MTLLFALTGALPSVLRRSKTYDLRPYFNLSTLGCLSTEIFLFIDLMSTLAANHIEELPPRCLGDCNMEWEFNGFRKKDQCLGLSHDEPGFD
jgi:hypothetical protein